MPKIEEGINPATYALQVPASCGRRVKTCILPVEMHLLVHYICATTFANSQVTNRSKERDLDKDFADVYEQSDLHRCASQYSPETPSSGLQDRKARGGWHVLQPCSAKALHPQRCIASWQPPSDLSVTVLSHCLLGGCRRALQMVEELSKPKEGSKPIHFDSLYAKGLLAQFKVLLWRNNHVYWR